LFGNFHFRFSQKDDSGPKIASLQGEIRRLERLLAGCKENEAGLRGEIGELQARLEFLANKEVCYFPPFPFFTFCPAAPTCSL